MAILASFFGFKHDFKKHSHILQQKGHSLEVNSPVKFMENNGTFGMDIRNLAEMGKNLA